MMKSKVFNLLLISLLGSFFLFPQNKISGIVYEENTNIALEGVSIYNSNNDLIFLTNEDGYFEIKTTENEIILTFLLDGYIIKEKLITLNGSQTLEIYLSNNLNMLNEVIVRANKKKIFQIQRLKDYEETAIYAGKKNETILMDLSMANLASNNSRQIYSQIPGLNIYQNDDAGIQLNVGGRGLDPNRTSNFNTRQNGYDISADALGYPESYYTPPSEALEKIQIIRGAASLQYGSQFGGLLNFIIKKPNLQKPLELISRNTLGSNALYTNFTSLSGKKSNLSYYGFVNYKKGNGFRENSEFESFNSFMNINYKFNEKSKISAEITYLEYLAHQAGGLSDKMFENNPLQTNRKRNWFEVNWFLFNIKYFRKITKNSNFDLTFFGLEAKRNALGFRTNRVDQIDPNSERDLIKGEFSNLGLEARFLSDYKIKGKKSILLIGSKLYKSKTKSIQGPGSDGNDANFNFYFNQFPSYVNQSEYYYPNNNFSFFGENIFYLSEKFSFTPGFRFENLRTQSDGLYKKINLDGAGNVILDQEVKDYRDNKRSLVLFGVGISYKPISYIEIYSNLSQNYRSVTFADISIINPAYSINPNISDEKGFTFDLGLRGNVKRYISYDTNFFSLFYNDRIGFVQRVYDDGSIKSERGNVGNAVIYGIESLVDFNLNELFFKNNDINFNYFINFSLIESEYTKSMEIGVEGKKVEFVPSVNIKTGLKYGYKNFSFNTQLSFISDQYTDSSNANEGNLSGVIGVIPSYKILDISSSYKSKKYGIEIGINNVLNNFYFTRRATGYPGPGIIPSPPRNYYITLELKI